MFWQGKELEGKGWIQICGLRCACKLLTRSPWVLFGRKKKSAGDYTSLLFICNYWFNVQEKHLLTRSYFLVIICTYDVLFDASMGLILAVFSTIKNCLGGKKREKFKMHIQVWSSILAEFIPSWSSTLFADLPWQVCEGPVCTSGGGQLDSGGVAEGFGSTYAGGRRLQVTIRAENGPLQGRGVIAGCRLTDK